VRISVSGTVLAASLLHLPCTGRLPSKATTRDGKIFNKVRQDC